jgi:hypothetical protein
MARCKGICCLPLRAKRSAPRASNSSIIDRREAPAAHAICSGLRDPCSPGARFTGSPASSNASACCGSPVAATRCSSGSREVESDIRGGSAAMPLPNAEKEDRDEARTTAACSTGVAEKEVERRCGDRGQGDVCTPLNGARIACRGCAEVPARLVAREILCRRKALSSRRCCWPLRGGVWVRTSGEERRGAEESCEKPEKDAERGGTDSRACFAPSESNAVWASCAACRAR